MISSADIKAHARSLGFDLVGIAPAAALPELTRLNEWLARGYAGEMTYLAKSAKAREDIRHVLPSARSVIVTGTVYYAESNTVNCGTRKVVRFWRQPLVGARELIGSLPRGRDPAMTSPVVMGDGSIELYFDRYICRTGASDIYKFVIPAP